MVEGTATRMGLNLPTAEWNVGGKRNEVFWLSQYVFGPDDWLTLNLRIYYALRVFKLIFYPILALVAVPVNAVTIVILSRGKCGLAKGVTRYLVAMAAADLIVIFIDLILRKIPIVYRNYFGFVRSIRVCDVHAFLLYTATDCSVWFTVTFTFDRFVSICCQKLKTNYCTERTALVVLGTVTALSCLKNISWCFMLTSEYSLAYARWFCMPRARLLESQIWGSIELLHYILTPIIPFILVLLFNALTIRHVLVASRARRRLRAPSSGEGAHDPEMASRRKSLILLLVISGNFILLWALFIMYYVWNRMRIWGQVSVFPPESIRELCFLLQLLSCCTNTALYVVTQTKFRDQFKDVVKSPFTIIAKRSQCCKMSNPRQCPLPRPTPQTA